MKRFLSLLICLVMLGSMFPFTIFAGADGEEHALRFLCGEGIPAHLLI